MAPGSECSPMRDVLSAEPVKRAPHPGSRLSLLALLLVAACSQQPPRQALPPFDASAARRALLEGSSTLSGRVMMRLSSGGVLSCANGRVRLIPATAYAEAWVNQTYRADPSDVPTPEGVYYLPSTDRPVEPALDPSFLSMTHETPCDRDGFFRFDRLADGDYYLEATLHWQKDIFDETHFYYGNTHHWREGHVVRRIHLPAGRSASLDLSWQVPNSRYSGLWD